MKWKLMMKWLNVKGWIIVYRRVNVGILWLNVKVLMVDFIKCWYRSKCVYLCVFFRVNVGIEWFFVEIIRYWIIFSRRIILCIINIGIGLLLVEGLFFV